MGKPMEGDIMKKFALFLSTIVLSVTAVADDATQDVKPEFTFAASGAELRWDLPEQVREEREPRALQDLEYQARVLNNKIEAELNERLNDRFSQQLENNF